MKTRLLDRSESELAMPTAVKLSVFEDKMGPEPSRLRVADAGVVSWQEQADDAFWLKLLLKVHGLFSPKLRISCTPDLVECRDYSHMFFACDNLLSATQMPGLAHFQETGTLTTRVFRPAAGQERTPRCKAVSIPLEVRPTRARVERALNNYFSMEPRDFLTYEDIGPSSHDDDDILLGLWVMCRLKRFLTVPPGDVVFQFTSNLTIDFFRWQFVLPDTAVVLEGPSTCSTNMFRPSVSSNPIVGPPGWIPLTGAGGPNERFVCTYYSVMSGFSTGTGRLLYERRARTLAGVSLHPNRITLTLADNRTASVVLDDSEWRAALLLTAHYYHGVAYPLRTVQLVRAYDDLCRRLNCCPDADVLQLVDRLGEHIHSSVGDVLGTREPAEVCPGSGFDRHSFLLLQRRMSDCNIDVASITGDFRAASESLRQACGPDELKRAEQQ